ncbi:MAG: hypothetical protein H7Y32_11475, partial [Chloroflexales bacterium]|nr:hypothetical protein [Chloroflexales bacterium]
MPTHATTDATLRAWLATRSASERATLTRLWALPASLGAAPDAEALADAMLGPVAIARALAALN